MKFALDFAVILFVLEFGCYPGRNAISEGDEVDAILDLLKRNTEKKVEENMSGRFIAWLLQRPKPMETENPEMELREIANRNAQNPLKCRHLGEECGGLHWPCCMINKDKPLCCSFPRGSDPFSGRCIYKKAGIVCNRIW